MSKKASYEERAILSKVFFWTHMFMALVVGICIGIVLS